MFESYTYEWKDEIREIGPAVLQSNYQEGEWEAAMHALVSQKNPNLYDLIKHNLFEVGWVGYALYLEERYEYLLYLTDSGFSKAGTHPQWVAVAIEEMWQDRMEEEIKDYIEWMQEASEGYIRKYYNAQME